MEGWFSTLSFFLWLTSSYSTRHPDHGHLKKPRADSGPGHASKRSVPRLGVGMKTMIVQNALWCCKSRELTMSRDILMAFITPLWKGSVNMRLALPCQTSLSCHSFHHYQRAFFRGRGERKRSLWLLPNRIWTEVIFSCLSLSLVVEPQRRTALKSWASRGINTHPILIWQRQPAQLWSWSPHVQKNFCWEEKQKHMWHAVVTGT